MDPVHERRFIDRVYILMDPVRILMDPDYGPCFVLSPFPFLKSGWQSCLNQFLRRKALPMTRLVSLRGLIQCSDEHPRPSHMGPLGQGTPYIGLYGEDPPKRDTFFRLLRYIKGQGFHKLRYIKG